MTMPAATPIPSSMQEHALAYTAPPLNWRLCKLRPRSKAPMLAEWNSHDRTIGHQRAAEAFSSEDHGIGLVHEASGTGAFDIDSVEWTAFAFSEFGFDLEAILAGYPRIVGRDGRDKILFRVPPTAALTNRKLRWPAPDANSKPITVFELRANGGQDVLPPSIHPDTGQPYRWRVSPFGFNEGIPMIPPMLLALWSDWPSFDRQLQAACPWAPVQEKTPPAPVRQVSSSHANVIGAFNQAYTVADLLPRYGYQVKGKRWLSPSSSTGIPGVVILKTTGHCYSHHASDLLNDGHSHDAFGLYCLMQHNGDFSNAVKAAARELGLPPARRTSSPPIPEVDFTELLDRQGRPGNAAPPTPTAPDHVALLPATPEDLLAPPGMIGHIAQHTLDTSQLPQPELAVANALCIASVALGRRVATRTGLRLNLQIVGVAKTAAGKEHARSKAKEILTAAKAAHLLGGEELASGQGLVSRLAAQPASLFQIDEFGLFLQAVQNPMAGSHKAEILTNFIKMHSAAMSVYCGTEYADQKARPRTDISHPCAVLYGTTTPETFFPALGSAHIASGYLNRMVVCFAPEARPTRRRARHQSVPGELTDWLMSAITLTDGGLTGTAECPLVMEEGVEAEKALMDFQALCDAALNSADSNGTAPLWGRAVEHATKIAALIELGINLKSRTISARAARWAVDFVQHWTEVMDHMVTVHVADSLFRRVVLDVVRLLAKSGAKGLTERELVKACRAYAGLRPFERDQVLDILKRDQEAVWCQIPAEGRGKPRTALVSTHYPDVCAACAIVDERAYPTALPTITADKTVGGIQQKNVNKTTYCGLPPTSADSLVGGNGGVFSSKNKDVAITADKMGGEPKSGEEEEERVGVF